MRGQIASVAAAVKRIRKDVADLRFRRLNNARFPKTGKKAGAEEKVIRRAFTQAIRDKKLIKLSIYSPYEARTEVKWRNNGWVVNTYRYIGVNCLAKLSTGQCMVYRMRFRNTKKQDGTWSELKHWSVGHVYEIMEANIDK